MIKHFTHSGMHLAGTVIAKQPTILGPKYHIKVIWDSNKYTTFTRMWWRTWEEQ